MSQLNLIWAQSLNGVIGVDNGLPWHLPEDLAHFRQMTKGKTVIMGRKTWDSLPSQFRPLPGRPNIVLSRQAEWTANGALVAKSLEEALRIPSTEEVWVIGGGAIYHQALPFADAIHITYVKQTIEGDTLAPLLPSPQWSQTYCSGWLKSTSGLEYAISRFEPKVLR